MVPVPRMVVGQTALFPRGSSPVSVNFIIIVRDAFSAPFFILLLDHQLFFRIIIIIIVIIIIVIVIIIFLFLFFDQKLDPFRFVFTSTPSFFHYYCDTIYIRIYIYLLISIVATRIKMTNLKLFNDRATAIPVTADEYRIG